MRFVKMLRQNFVKSVDDQRTLARAETPVTAVNVPNGICMSTFCKLFPEAPKIFRDSPLPLRRFSGIGMRISPLRYFPCH